MEPRPRESFKSRGWDDDALAPHRRYGFKIHLQSSESATVICVLLWERELEPNIACAFDDRSRMSCNVMSTVVRLPRFGLKLALSTLSLEMCRHPLLLFKK